MSGQLVLKWGILHSRRHLTLSEHQHGKVMAPGTQRPKMVVKPFMHRKSYSKFTRMPLLRKPGQRKIKFIGHGCYSFCVIHVRNLSPQSQLCSIFLHSKSLLCSSEACKVFLFCVERSTNYCRPESNLHLYTTIFAMEF